MVKEFKRLAGGELFLTKDALSHIVEGDVVIRPLKDKRQMKVLSGGLHTVEGWLKFKNNYIGELVHLHAFNSDIHKYWYYARELSNGVITLRIPRELYTGKAAKITMYPDDYYKSGYLWKTLFPKDYDEVKIEQLITEALANEDEAQSKKGQIVGYANNNTSERMKVIIQCRGKYILSAFPAWTQPNSGNVGKPYSYYENIGFIIALSTEYFNDKVTLDESVKLSFVDETIINLPLYTPNIFITRSAPSANENSEEWVVSRRAELENITLSEFDLNTVFKYMTDFTLIKYYPEIVSGAYVSSLEDIRADIKCHNVFQICQNFIDGLNYFYFKGHIDKLNHIIIYMLENMVSHVLLDILLKKRLLSEITRIVRMADVPELSYTFIVHLSRSPVRREAYFEYNVSSIYKKKMKVPLEDFPSELVLINNPELDLDFTYEDFLEVLKELLGETYTLNYDDESLNKIINDVIENNDIKDQVDDSLKYFSNNDFKSLSYDIETILLSAVKHEKSDEIVECVGLILRDYCRIQFAHRQRINARYVKYSEYSRDMYLPVDHNLLYGLVLKHERITNSINLNRFTSGIMSFAKSVGNKPLENDVKNFISRIGRESPPLPEVNSVVVS